MRIISPFRDYYDSVQGLGFDSRCTYIRRTQKFVVDQNTEDQLKPLLRLMMGNLKDFDGCNKLIIGFCGKLYPVWQLIERRDKPNPYFYNPETLLKFLRTEKSLQRAEAEFTGMKSDYYKIYNRRLTHESMNLALAEILQNTKLNHLFVQHKVPCFVIKPTGLRNRRYDLMTNPCLKDYGFYKIEDTFSAYQNINQYISGILGLDDPEIQNIDDEHMKVKRGFDDWSFKKLPTKRR